MVLPAYTPALQPNNRNREELIAQYFNQGFTNSEILFGLSSIHGILLSLAQLKRILRRHNLKRRPTQGFTTPVQDIVGAILDIIQYSGQCLGYRTVWKRLRRMFDFPITRKTVMELMRVIDSEGVERRRKRRLLRRRYTAPGPNFVWHVDGYDKLKPFGFAIHGAIDGFSRRILWLEVGRSNNDPRVIATYYLETVRQLKGTPIKLRCDLGTENSKLEELQTFFTIYSDPDSSGDGCFQYGKSTSNQRIEAWWSILRRQASDWWINVFKDLREAGLIRDHDPLYVECLRFCFMTVLQNELDQVAILWNQHTIQVKKANPGPRGKPDSLYFLPEMNGGTDYKIECDIECIEQCQQLYGTERPQHGCSPEFHELLNLFSPNGDIEAPDSVEKGTSLYAQLVGELDRLDN